MVGFKGHVVSLNDRAFPLKLKPENIFLCLCQRDVYIYCGDLKGSHGIGEYSSKRSQSLGGFRRSSSRNMKCIVGRLSSSAWGGVSVSLADSEQP